MNKKLIRLTESDLHRIVKESVNKIINEIGDSPKGQHMLGRLHGKYAAQDKWGKAGNVWNYVRDNGIDTDEYWRGNDEERKKKKYKKPGWMGCENIEMIWHGEWSDPELEYNGSVANYWDVESWCAETCKEEGVNPNNKDAFAAWIRQNEERIGMTIQEMSNDF